MLHLHRFIAAAFASAAAGVAAATPHSHEPQPAAVAQAPVPFRSAFEGYRRFNPDEAPTDWRAANEAVREAGGHIGLIRAQRKEARQLPEAGGAQGARPGTHEHHSAPSKAAPR